MPVLQSLHLGLAVLDLLLETSVPVRTSDVAARLGIDKAIASRVLNTLVVSGYATRSNKRGFVAGPRVSRHGGGQLEELLALREAIRGLLVALVEISGESAHIGILVGNKIWHLDKASSPHPLRVDYPVGTWLPVHCTALGKAFLAFGSEVTLGELTRSTYRTITTAEELAEELEKARNLGYTQDDEEFCLGVRCVAAPIYSRTGRMLAAIGLSIPSVRVSPRQLSGLGTLVRDRSSTLLTATRFLSGKPADTSGAQHPCAQELSGKHNS